MNEEYIDEPDDAELADEDLCADCGRIGSPWDVCSVCGRAMCSACFEMGGGVCRWPHA